MKCVPSQQKHQTQLIIKSSMPFGYKRPYYGPQLNGMYRGCTELILHIYLEIVATAIMMITLKRCKDSQDDNYCWRFYRLAKPAESVYMVLIAE